MAFNPNDYLINLKGKKYLQVAHRVLWFKTENANGAITTEVLQTEPFPLVKAYISIDGAVIATGHGTAQISNNAVYKGREIEKAETAAIGRALANAGYGTQFSEMVNDDSDDLADAPLERATTAKNGDYSAPASIPSASPQNTAKNADAIQLAVQRITVLQRKDGYQYIAHCGHGINIVEYSRDKWRKLGASVETWNDGVTAKGKVIPLEPEVMIKAVTDGNTYKLLEVIG